MPREVMEVLGIIAISGLVLGGLTFAVIRHLPHSRSLSGIFLARSTSRETGYISAPERDDLVGRIGLTVTDLRPSGTASFDEERIDVVTEGPFIEAGARVVVLRADGYRHLVREVGDEDDDVEGGVDAADDGDA